MDASGKSIRGILMQIPQEIYDERCREQQEEITRLELALAEPPAELNMRFIDLPGNPQTPAGLNVGATEPEAEVKY